MRSKNDTIGIMPKRDGWLSAIGRTQHLFNCHDLVKHHTTIDLETSCV